MRTLAFLVLTLLPLSAAAPVDVGVAETSDGCESRSDEEQSFTTHPDGSTTRTQHQDIEDRCARATDVARATTEDGSVDLRVTSRSEAAETTTYDQNVETAPDDSWTSRGGSTWGRASSSFTGADGRAAGHELSAGTGCDSHRIDSTGWQNAGDATSHQSNYDHDGSESNVCFTGAAAAGSRAGFESSRGGEWESASHHDGGPSPVDDRVDSSAGDSSAQDGQAVVIGDARPVRRGTECAGWHDWEYAKVNGVWETRREEGGADCAQGTWIATPGAAAFVGEKRHGDTNCSSGGCFSEPGRTGAWLSEPVEHEESADVDLPFLLP